MPALTELLGVYLLPFALGVPLALGLYWLTSRRPDDTGAAPTPPADGEPVRRPAPAEVTTETTAGAPSTRSLTSSATPATACQATAKVHPAAAVSTPPRPASARARVLVADDSAVARAKLKRLLEGAGYAVDLVGDGVQAQAQLARQRYDVLITDLEMPELDGLQLIALVQGSLDTEDLPIIAITGHESLVARVHDCQGLFGIFRKPWNDRELLKRVAAVASLRASVTTPMTA